MRHERFVQPNPDMQQAVEELEGLVLSRYPTASFEAGPGEDDPSGIYITATVDVDDPDEVVDLVIDRMLELQIEQGLPVYLVPIRTPERVAKLRQEQAERHPVASPSLPL